MPRRKNAVRVQIWTGARQLSPSCPQVYSFAYDQRILAALCSVSQTPHARGMPTKAQNSAALASRPPLPMPYDPDADGPDALAAPACSFATSASLMYHFGSTGLIR